MLQPMRVTCQTQVKSPSIPVGLYVDVACVLSVASTNKLATGNLGRRSPRGVGEIPTRATTTSVHTMFCASLSQVCCCCCCFIRIYAAVESVERFFSSCTELYRRVIFFLRGLCAQLLHRSGSFSPSLLYSHVLPYSFFKCLQRRTPPPGRYER